MMRMRHRKCVMLLYDVYVCVRFVVCVVAACVVILAFDVRFFTIEMLLFLYLLAVDHIAMYWYQVRAKYHYT